MYLTVRVNRPLAAACRAPLGPAPGSVGGARTAPCGPAPSSVPLPLPSHCPILSSLELYPTRVLRQFEYSRQQAETGTLKQQLLTAEKLESKRTKVEIGR